MRRGGGGGGEEGEEMRRWWGGMKAGGPRTWKFGLGCRGGYDLDLGFCSGYSMVVSSFED